MADSTRDDTPQKRRKAREPVWWTPFLESLSRNGNVLLSCKAAGIARKTAYRHRDKHPRFAGRWEDAIDDAVDVLEAEARRRAINGVDKTVYYKGAKIDTVKEYSDLLIIFLLKASRPEKYRDNYDLKRLIEGLRAERPDTAEPGTVGATGD